MGKLILIGADHAAYELKENIISELKSQGYEIKDFGTNSTESVDYPNIAHALAKEVSKTQTRGILLCGSGIGMSIAANKISGVRAALCHNPQYAEMSRKHNDANILCIGARFVSELEAKSIIKTWLETDFEGARHQKRVDLIEKGI